MAFALWDGDPCEGLMPVSSMSDCLSHRHYCYCTARVGEGEKKLLLTQGEAMGAVDGQSQSATGRSFGSCKVFAGDFGQHKEP